MARNIIIATGVCVVAGIMLAAFDFHDSRTISNIFEKSYEPSKDLYRWTRLTDNAAFSKSYNFQLITYRDSLWAFHPDGNYYSLDGKTWTKSALTNVIHNLAFLDYVQFNNSIMGLGHFEGNIERFSQTTEINRTTDMKRWKRMSKESNLPRRFFY